MDWLSFLADVSVRSLVPAAAALLAIAVARARSASVKHAVWTAVLCAMLALPLLSAALPPVAWRILRPAVAVSVSPAPATVAQAPALAVAAPAEVPAPRAPAWPAVAAWIYLLVAAALLARLALGLLLTRRMMKRSTPVDSASLALPGIALAESNAIAVPLAAGWLRPRILLPAGWREWERTKLDAVLAHEAAHVERRDWLVAVLARLNACLFWFHPLSWWMERKLAALAEEACDESSLLATGDREAYARVLLEMAEAVRAGRGRLAWRAVGMAHSQVGRRIEAVLDESRRFSRGMTKARWAAVLLSAVPLVYGAAALRLEPAAAPAQADSLSRASRITAADAERLEAHLLANPDDLAARGTLISFYASKGLREPRLKHIFWLIENRPESEVAASAFASGGPLNTPADYARARDLWLEQARRHESDPRVLGNAATFSIAHGGDLAAAADLLARAASLDGAYTEHLASLYASVIVGATRPQSPSLAGLPGEPALAERFKAELEASTDTPLLAGTASAIAALAGSGAGPELFPAVDFGRKLTERAGVTAAHGNGDPESRFARLERFANSQQPPEVRFEELERAINPGVSGGVSGGVIGGVTGGVAGGVTGGVAGGVPGGIGVGGRPPKVRSIRFEVSPEGPERVAALSLGAVTAGLERENARIEVEKPLDLAAVVKAAEVLRDLYARNGQAVNVYYTIGSIPPRSAEVVFRVEGLRAGTPGRVLRSGPSRPQPIRRAEPVYPPLARQARIEGMVLLRAVVGVDGKAADITAVSGHPLLVPAAIDALRQWEFKPAESGGRPVSASATFEMNFRLLGGGDAPPDAGATGGINPRLVMVQPRVEGEISARPVRRVDPVYPPLARQTRIQGTVVLRAVVGEDGRARDIGLVSGHPLLVPAAEDALRQWEFKPAESGGRPVSRPVTVEIHFALL